MPGDHEITGPNADEATTEGLSRRRLLGGAAAGGAALLVVGSQIGRAAAATTSTAASKLPRVPANSGIDHVIVVTMENRSFDHYLGWVQGADGPRAKQKYRDAAGVAHPIWHLDSFTGEGYHDPNHSHVGGVAELNGGACDGWLVAPNNDLYSIGYYRDTDLDFYRGAAPLLDRLRPVLRVDPRADLPQPLLHALGPDRPHHEHQRGRDHADDLGLAGHRGSRRALLLLRPAVRRPLRRQVRVDQPSDRRLLHRLQRRATWPTSPTSTPASSPRPTGPRATTTPTPTSGSASRSSTRSTRPSPPGPQWANTLLVITYDEWGGFFDHVVPGVAPDVVPENGQRGLPHPDAAHRSPGAPPQRVAPHVRPHVDPQVHRVAVRPARADAPGRRGQQPRRGAAVPP